MNNTDEMIAAGIQDKLQHVADVQHELVDNTPKTAEQWHDLIQNLLGGAVDFCFKLIAAIAILMVGMWVANKITRSVKFAMEKKKLEPSLVSFISSFINILLRIFVIIIVLTTVGVQMTSIVAVLGAGALAVGMALSGTFQNFAGGIIILFLDVRITFGRNERNNNCRMASDLMDNVYFFFLGGRGRAKSSMSRRE